MTRMDHIRECLRANPGARLAEIAAAWKGVGEIQSQLVTAARRQLGIQDPRKAGEEGRLVRNARIVEKRRKGESIAAVARDAGISQRQAWQILQDAEVSR